MYNSQMQRSRTPGTLYLAIGAGLVGLAAVGALLWGVMTAYNWATSYTVSTGMRHGIVQKFSYKGIIPSCRSYEGELVLIGLRTKTVTSPKAPDAVAAGLTNTWEFSTKDEAVAKQIEAAMDTGAPVTLHYRQTVMPGFCNTATVYQITKVTADAANQAR